MHGADPAAAKPSAKGAGTFDPDESLAAAQEAAGVAAEEQEQVQPQKQGPTPAQRTAIQVSVLQKYPSRQLHECILKAVAGKVESKLEYSV